MSRKKPKTGKMAMKSLGPVRSPFHWIWGRPRENSKKTEEPRSGSYSQPVNKEILPIPIRDYGTKKLQKEAAKRYQKALSRGGMIPILSTKDWIILWSALTREYLKVEYDNRVFVAYHIFSWNPMSRDWVSKRRWSVGYND